MRARTQPMLPVGYVEGVAHEDARHSITTQRPLLNALDGAVPALRSSRPDNRCFGQPGPT